MIEDSRLLMNIDTVTWESNIQETIKLICRFSGSSPQTVTFYFASLTGSVLFRLDSASPPNVQTATTSHRPPPPESPDQWNEHTRASPSLPLSSSLPLCLSLSLSLPQSLHLSPNFWTLLRAAAAHFGFCFSGLWKPGRVWSGLFSVSLCGGRMILQGDQLPLQWKHVSPPTFMFNFSPLLLRWRVCALRSPPAASASFLPPETSGCETFSLSFDFFDFFLNLLEHRAHLHVELLRVDPRRLVDPAQFSFYAPMNSTRAGLELLRSFCLWSSRVSKSCDFVSELKFDRRVVFWFWPESSTLRWKKKKFPWCCWRLL